MLLPLLSAGLGAYEGYKEGGLPGAITGGVVGGLTPAAFRMAGTALMGSKLAVPAVEGATTLIGSAAQKARLANLPGVASNLRQAASTVSKVTPKQVGSLLAGTGILLGAPALAGGLTGKATEGVISNAGKAVGLGRTVQGVVTQDGQFIPLEGSATAGMPTTAETAVDMLNPAGKYMGALELQRRAQDISREGAAKLMELERPYLEESKLRDFQRGTAAARFANELAMQRGLTLGGQEIAGNLAGRALGDVGAGLRTQYNYF